MDECSSRRTASGLVISRKSPGLVLRDSSESPRDRNVQVCSRAGCSSKLNPMKPSHSQIGSPSSRAKATKTPFRPPGLGKEIIGSSSKILNTSRKPISDPKKSKLHSRDSETSSLQEHSEGVSKSAESESSNSESNNRLVKRNTRRFGLGSQDSQVGSSASFSSKQTNQGSKNGGGASTSKHNLRNLRCNSISDVVSSSSTESPMGKRRDIGRKRIGEPESCLPARGKKITGPMMDDKRSENSNRGISICDSRRTRNVSPAVDNNEITSVRNRRSIARTRVGNQENGRRLPMVESPLRTPSPPQPEMSLDSMASSSENRFSVQNPSSRASSFSRPNRSSGPPNESAVARPNFMNRGALRQYNLDGIAEMLLALERIEQEDEPSYEQLLVLETNLFLGGLAFHDQHRDMRLDIDNMSYEELLALEDRIGTVSTAVPEEDLVMCLKRTTFQGITKCRENKDDVKCSICQEEYADGEEIGRLKCEHKYHVDCINHWLRLKNWCPICKASVVTSPSQSLS